MFFPADNVVGLNALLTQAPQLSALTLERLDLSDGVSHGLAMPRHLSFLSLQHCDLDSLPVGLYPSELLRERGLFP